MIFRNFVNEKTWQYLELKRMVSMAVNDYEIASKRFT